jgi:hypothetical protein
MVTVENVGELQRGTLVVIGALVGICSTYTAGTAVLRVGGQVTGPVASSKDVPLEVGAPVYIDKDGLTTIASKTARAVGVLLSKGPQPRVFLRGIIA